MPLLAPVINATLSVMSGIGRLSVEVECVVAGRPR
jgi:hypothetical protein